MLDNGSFFLEVWHNVHNSRSEYSEVVSHTTTAFMLPMLLLLEFCFYRTTHDADLDVQLVVLHPELVLL